MLVLLPGLGADERLFAAQREVFPDLLVPSWPAPQPRETLPSFAGRLAEAIPRSAPLYLAGASFGGMVALELAALVRPRAVILIGSCAGPHAVTPLVRHLRGLARALPAGFFRPRRWSLPLVLPWFGRLTAGQREVFWSMGAKTPASFLKWGVSAILSWRPTPVTAPVWHIHGSDDRLIPLRLVRPDRVVAGGGHLLTLTHPREVNAYLAERIQIS
jgi:pimeloyl-ACP methyl ester carboxylesterase